MLTSNSQDVLILSSLLVRVAFGDRGEHAFEKYDSRWEPMCGISIPGNINDRVSIGTRNKSNGACSSRQWSRASCILPSSPSPLPLPFGYGCTIGSVAILFHLFYFHFLQYIFVNSSRNRFIDRDSNLYTYKIRGYIRGFYEAESSSPVQARARERAAEKSQKILSDFAANSTKYGEEFFAGACGYFARAIGILRDGIYLQLR